MRVKQLDARDGLELTAPLVEKQLGVTQRLEACAEARFRAANAFRNGTDAPTCERVEVKDTVGLAEPKRPEHDRLRLVRAPGHFGQV